MENHYEPLFAFRKIQSKFKVQLVYNFIGLSQLGYSIKLYGKSRRARLY